MEQSESTDARGFGSERTMLDPVKVEMHVQQMRENQDLSGGIAAGLIAAAIAALGWMLITLVTQYHLGLVAIGVGFVVGYAVRKYGHGMDPRFGVAGAVLSLLGCAVGDILAVVILTAGTDGSSFGELTRLFLSDPRTIGALLRATFSPMDLFFYGFAAFEGYKFSIRKLRLEDLKHLTV